MKSFLNKLVSQLRSYKFTYTLYNFLHPKKVRRYKSNLKKYGVKKSAFGSVSSKDFEHLNQTKPWLDLSPEELSIKSKAGFNDFDEATQKQIIEWSENGYLILRNFYSSEQVDSINSEVDSMLKDNKVSLKYGGRKIMFAFKQSKIIEKCSNDPRLIKLLNFILDREVEPFSSINFIRGSEQKAHSDYVHMTTYPPGNLIAAWMAFEDVNLDNGTIFYHPGSHKLPYILNPNFNHGGSKTRIGSSAYKNYELKMEEVIQKNSFIKQDFIANKGDVFIWHANLLHGGNPILKSESTRKSMVVHYFPKDVIAYHEITQRPALIDFSPTE